MKAIIIARGIKKISSGKSKGINSLVYETYEIERIAKIAFELAKKRKGIVCSVDKANVLESTLLWRDVVSKTHKKYKGVVQRRLPGSATEGRGRGGGRG